MKFNEKIQHYRKQIGLTQEELAEKLYVSRTAISKWEAGRGYPSIDSLKAIAKFFSVTVDELLTPDQILTIAEEDNKQKQTHTKDLVFGLLDICLSLLFFLPFFASVENGIIQSVSLVALSTKSLYLKIAYYLVVILTIITGIFTLALQNCRRSFWLQTKTKISLFIGIAGVLLFIISSQPYPAVFTFVLLTVKTLLLIKR
jgi:transcriptional regulator with XRE-family HTH domain